MESTALAIVETERPSYLSREHARALDFAADALSPRTKRIYALLWRQFSAWCQEHGHSALPAEPADVADYLAELADRGRKVSTLGLVLVAVSQAHRQAGLESPRGAAIVKRTLQGIRRRLAETHPEQVAVRRVAPVLAEELRAILRALPDNPRGRRDAALLAVAFGVALRRSEAVALRVSDVTFTENGAEVRLRRSKTSQTAAVTLPLPFAGAGDVCPVRLLRRYLELLGDAEPESRLFRSVGKSGRLGASLSDRTVALIVQSRCREAGIVADVSGHSLRAGFCTSHAKAGTPDRVAMKVSRHKSAAIYSIYVRSRTLWEEVRSAI